jgi:hypothetical protein
MMPIRSRRHAVFAAAAILYVVGITAAIIAGVPSILAVTACLIAVAAWSYGPRVAIPVMLLANAATAALFVHFAGPEGVLTLHPLRVLIPIALMESFLLIGLSSVRRLELRQLVAEAELRRKNAQLEAVNAQLEAALAEVRELRGLVPICAWCKSIRDMDGAWDRLESYLIRHSRATLTHGVCPECLDRQMAQVSVSAAK